jgi:hypothetical protein
MEAEIKQILVDGIGWIYCEDGEIRCFEQNGEMAKIKWYGQGKKIWNSRYVISLEYK